MYRKSVRGVIAALSCSVLVTGSVFAVGARKNLDGQGPVQVIVAPGSAIAGNGASVTVYLDGVSATTQAANLSFTGPNLNEPGPDCTIPAGSDHGSVQATIDGNSGDVITVTATLNGGQASETITLP